MFLRKQIRIRAEQNGKSLQKLYQKIFETCGEKDLDVRTNTAQR